MNGPAIVRPSQQAEVYGLDRDGLEGTEMASLFIIPLISAGHWLRCLFQYRKEKASTLDLAYFPTCPLISKQMSKKRGRITGTKPLNNRAERLTGGNRNKLWGMGGKVFF